MEVAAKMALSALAAKMALSALPQEISIQQNLVPQNRESIERKASTIMDVEKASTFMDFGSIIKRDVRIFLEDTHRRWQGFHVTT